MSKGTLAAESQGYWEGQRCDWALRVGSDLWLESCLVFFLPLGLRFTNVEFVWEFTSFQPTHERMNWWASLSPISKHPRELLFGASCLGIKPGWAKFASDEEEEEGWGITTDLGGSTDLLLDQVTVSRWTDQILWPFLEQEFWTKITTEMHKAKRPGKHLMDPVNYKAFSHTLLFDHHLV